MLEKLISSPAMAMVFIVFVVYLAAIYFTNRERAKAQSMKSVRRFQPDWRRTGAGGNRRKRRRHRGDAFQPEWSRKSDRSNRSSESSGSTHSTETSKKPEDG